jgi:hypothetical protein
MIAEISFDLIMEGNMDFAEGTYRLPGGNWQVFIFSRRSIRQSEINASAKWASGVTGMSVQFPKSQKLDKAVVMEVLSDELGVTEWKEVHGPDSMQLR